MIGEALEENRRIRCDNYAKTKKETCKTKEASKEQNRISPCKARDGSKTRKEKGTSCWG